MRACNKLSARAAVGSLDKLYLTLSLPLILRNARDSSSTKSRSTSIAMLGRWAVDCNAVFLAGTLECHLLRCMHRGAPLRRLASRTSLLDRSKDW